MAKKVRKTTSKKTTRKVGTKAEPADTKPTTPTGRPSAEIDTRVVYCGDCLDKLADLPDNCVDLISIDPPFNSNRNPLASWEVFWGMAKEKRAFEDRHASTQASIDSMRPRCVQLAHASDTDHAQRASS